MAGKVEMSCPAAFHTDTEILSIGAGGEIGGEGDEA